MDDFTAARGVHVASIILWIGGVAFVTMVAMPAIRRSSPADQRVMAFHRLESGFAWQARIWVAVAGASGLWMVVRAALWSRFLDPAFWWMHAMVLVWLAFAAMLFVIEPLFLHRRLAASPQPAADFDRMEKLHRLLTIASLVTVLGAVAGSHGVM